MLLLRPFLSATLPFLLFLTPITAQSSPTTSLTISYWPLSSPSALPLARVSLIASDVEISSYTPPKQTTSDSDSNLDSLVRIGFTSPKTKEWTGTVASLEALSDNYKKRFTIRVSGNGEPYSISLATTGKAGGEGEDVTAVVLRDTEGVKPVLNRPVVLREDGQAPGQEEVEKSFFQKYWWVFLLVAVFAMGQGGDGK